MNHDHQKIKACLLILLGSAIQAFGLYHVHACSGVTEGGVLGLTLLLQRWLVIIASEFTEPYRIEPAEK